MFRRATVVLPACILALSAVLPALAQQPASRPAFGGARGTTSRPATQPASRPAIRPEPRPALRPGSRPASQPATRPASRPTSRPASRPTSAPAAKEPELTQAIPFSVPALSGKQVNFPADYRGKLVLVTFWATWCPHCRNEVKLWHELYEKYHANGLEIIGLSTDKNRSKAAETVADYAKENGMAWEIIFDDGPRLMSPYGVKGIPTSFLIDGDTGQVLAQRRALRKDALLPTVAEKLAAKRGTGQPAPVSQPVSPPGATSQPAPRAPA